MPNMKKPAPPRGFVQRTPSTGTGIKKPMPKTVTKAPAKSKMTPQDAAMLKILKKKYGANVYKG
jgi:hypothetical protein